VRSKHDYWRFTVYRFASTAVRHAMQIIILPILVLRIAEEAAKGYYLSLVAVCSLSVGFPAFLLAAYLGDVIPWVSIRRRLFIGLGVLICLTGMLISHWIDSTVSLLLASILVFAGISTSESSHSALIPDNMDEADYQRASGWLTQFTFLGSLLGPLLAGAMIDPKINRVLGVELLSGDRFYLPAVWALGGILLLAACINMLFIKESERKMGHEVDGERSLKSVLFSSDPKVKRFYIFLVMRCCALLSPITMPGFLLYYQRDLLKAMDPVRATAVGATLLTLGALLGVLLLAPRLLRRYSAIRTMAIALFLMAFSLTGFAMVMFPFLWCAAITLFGVGYGLFFSLSFSFSLNIIPHARWQGLFTSLASSTTFVSYILGMMLAGPLLDHWGYEALGGLFLVSLLGALVMLYLLHGSDPMKSNHGPQISP
jgi:MFS family permease